MLSPAQRAEFTPLPAFVGQIPVLVYLGINGHRDGYSVSVMLDALARLARGSAMQWLALFSLGREPDAFWAHITTARQTATARSAAIVSTRRQ